MCAREKREFFAKNIKKMFRKFVLKIREKQLIFCKKSDIMSARSGGVTRFEMENLCM